MYVDWLQEGIIEELLYIHLFYVFVSYEKNIYIYCALCVCVCVKDTNVVQWDKGH
jgi:hypothetical protein